MNLKPLNERFVDENYSKYAFSDKVLVVCPKCHQRAEVTYDNKTGNKALHCFHCHHSEKGDDVHYENTVKRHCDNCGEQILVKIASKNKMESLTIKCQNCGQSRDYKPNSLAIRTIFRDSGDATDPHYDHPLWLQGNIKGNLFWAYNDEHLDYLKQYITAKIRERAVGATFMTMIARLPNFIKSAKNRPTLLKLIEKLEKKKS